MRSHRAIPTVVLTIPTGGTMPPPLLPDPELHDVDDRVELSYPSGDLALVDLVGEHDIGQYAPLTEALHLAGASRQHVIVDLSRCAFMDSTVIALLLNANDEVAAGGGQFALVIPAEQRPMTRVSEVMGLVELFAIYASAEAAVASTEQAAPWER